MEVEKDLFEKDVMAGKAKVVCPHCEKSYLILAQDLPEEANRFICKSCSRDFWVRRSDVEMESELVGIPGEELTGEEKDKCPKCGQEVESLEKECAACGVIGAKFLALRDDTPYLKVSEQLKTLWKRVLNNYDDERIHHEFLSQCLKEKQLRYGALQYKQLKEAVGEDSIVRGMLGKIQNLSSMEMDLKTQASQKEAPTKKSYFRFLRWEAFLAAIGIFCILSGLASPMARNLISLGVVILALPFLIALLLRRQ